MANADGRLGGPLAHPNGFPARRSSRDDLTNIGSRRENLDLKNATKERRTDKHVECRD